MDAASQRKNNITIAMNTWLQNIRTPRTHTTYKLYIEQFRCFVQDAGHDLDGYSIDFNDVPTPEMQDKAIITISEYAQDWSLIAMKKEQLSAASIKHRLSVLSSFYTFARKRRLLRMENPIETITPPSLQRDTPISPLTKDDISKVLDAIDQSSLAGKRDYALLLILISTGRRGSEVLKLQWKHIHTDNEKIILCYEKNTREMQDVLDPRVKLALTTYLTAMFPDGLEDEQHLWLSLAHQHYKQPLTLRGLADIFKNLMKVINLDTMKIETTRHTYAYNSVKNGANILDIQKRLGHKDASSTSRYLARLNKANNKHDSLVDLLEIE